MYTRDYEQPPQPREVPSGYAGSAFTQEEAAREPAGDTQEASACACHPQKRRKQNFFLDRLLPPSLSQFDLRGFLTGDLLLIVLALLLVTGGEGDCEEDDHDIWLLLLLLVFIR